MAVHCKFCRATDVQPEATTYLCLMCGRRTPQADVVAEQQRQIVAEAEAAKAAQ